MAKVSFNKLDLKKNQKVVTLKYNDIDFEVRQYLPIEEKLELISKVISNSADENNFYNDAHIVGHSDDFMAINKFDFNGGHVSYDGKDYTITSIEPQAFSTTIFNSNKLFYNCDLVIPSTIKTIGFNAFGYNGDPYNAKIINEIKSITFQEGVQTIESWAFKNVFGYKYGAITFPNSITTINAGAFANSKLAQINLYKLDHVINSNTNNPISIFGSNIMKIYVHDSNIKNNYLNIEGGKWSEISSLIESVY